MDYSPKEPQSSPPPVTESCAPIEKNTSGNSKEEGAETELQRIQTEEDFSVYSHKEKIFFVIMASMAGFLSPVSTTIYYPALPTLAIDFNTSLANINLTVTTFLIFQGLAPTIVGSISDDFGRRPMYLACLLVYICANIGLAVQKTYAGLLILRMLQSSGSSGAVALANALVSDIVTSAQRGSYISYVQMGALVGPAFGPVIGGLLNSYLGWRAIFWFLTIVSGVVFFVVLIFLPETCRKVVGNGSIAPPAWNTSLLSHWHQKKQREAGIEPNYAARSTVKRRINPVKSFYILFDKESAIVLFYTGFVFTGFYMVLVGLPGVLEDYYGYDSLQIGLCYIPGGLGNISATFVMGRFLDFNFRRHAKRVGIEISKNRQQDLRKFPIEIARLQVVFPLAYSAGACTIIWAWMMQKKVFIAGPLVFIYLATFFIGCSWQGLSTLVVDLNRDSPSSATAAMNLTRCLIGAAGTAAVVPMLKSMGIGWVGVFVAGMWIFLSPVALCVIKWGPQWREEKLLRMEKKAAAKNEAAIAASGAEEGNA